MLACMRHGPAEDEASTGRDFDRELTRQGRFVVARSGELLLAGATSSSAWMVHVSPFVRAQQTADIVTRALTAAGHGVTVETAVALGVGAPVSNDWLQRVVAPAAALAQPVLLIGHQPSIESITLSFLTRDASSSRARPLPHGFRTGMVAWLVPEAGSSGSAAASLGRWRLDAIWDPHLPESP